MTILLTFGPKESKQDLLVAICCPRIEVQVPTNGPFGFDVLAARGLAYPDPQGLDLRLPVKGLGVPKGPCRHMTPTWALKLVTIS